MALPSNPAFANFLEDVLTTDIQAFDEVLEE